ncbi:heterokaryon incompatibility protein [Colletotrichum orchidophilum]|uniref:Heterokaryon incompatibility protein n=1 Tax=Colletotrichum orchidophilum TaxID=1209926 RepID=A0A1G4AUG7_9PEZI|nr:heterokaryon incompatibility protein [Colletotrichum orchidophilum]OHE92819.1 heterokaryon incompatibility protein [Colletotrichum orchidophilum]
MATAQIVPMLLEDAPKVRSKSDTQPRSFDFFDVFGTAGCLQQCAVIRSRQTLSPQAIKQSKADHEELLKHGKYKLVRGKAFTYKELDASAVNGCGSCKAVKTFLDSIPAKHFGGLIPSTIIRWTIRHSGTLELEAPDGKEYFVRLLNLAGSSNVFRRLETTNGVTGDTSSDTSFQRIQAWLNNCELHGKCGKGKDTRLPTRLIDVRQPGDRLGVRLVETSGQTGTYICLSHCWGKIKIKSKTETHSLKRRLNLIPWCLLPPSFQQAVEITRKLGVRYLWIDSLCIIQDDKGDWEREAAEMVNVYRNSYATIAFFKIENDNCDEFFISLIFGEKRDKLSEYAKVQEYIPLFNRAWCLQERLLSRRIIHCNYGEMAFDCASGYTCECGGKQHYSWHNLIRLSGTYTPLQSKSNYLALLNKPKIIPPTAIITKDGKIDPYGRWHGVITEYTCLNLTFTGDMLPALSGLAHETAEVTKDTFLAGMWKRNFEQDLMWRVVAVADWVAQRAKILRRGWIAPTWSWASTGSGCKRQSR